MAFTNKHTQGEWVVTPNFRNPNVKNEFGQVIFEHNPNCYDNTEKDGEKMHTYYSHNKMMANAKLISAAPELRQCVEMFHDYLSNNKSENSIAMKVVKKALLKAGVEFEKKEK